MLQEKRLKDVFFTYDVDFTVTYAPTDYELASFCEVVLSMEDTNLSYKNQHNDINNYGGTGYIRPLEHIIITETFSLIVDKYKIMHSLHFPYIDFKLSKVESR